MSLLIWILVGGIAGWLASKIMKTDASMGVGANIVVGIVGALIGGWLVGLTGGSADVMTGFNLASLFTALVGAVVLLAILKLFRKK